MSSIVIRDACCGLSKHAASANGGVGGAQGALPSE